MRADRPGLGILILLVGLLIGAWPVRRIVRSFATDVAARHRWRRHCALPDPPQCEGRPVAWLSIPSVRLEALVLRGVTERDLLRGPCMATAYSGAVRRTPRVILAHRDRHFRALRHIGEGDLVRLEHTDGSKTTYRVVSAEVLPPDRVRVRLADRGVGPGLALLTCHPFQYVGPAPNRFLVLARPVDPMIAGPAVLLRPDPREG